jgi:hypothetical protein
MEKMWRAREKKAMKKCFVRQTTTSHCVNQLSENLLRDGKAFCGGGAYNRLEHFAMLCHLCLAPGTNRSARFPLMMIDFG